MAGRESAMTNGPSEYQRAYERSLRDPEGFWAEAAQAISWTRPFDRVLDDSRAPFVRWFPGGMLNTCYNAVDRHVARGRGKQVALIYDSPSPTPSAASPMLNCVMKWRSCPARCARSASKKATGC